ncbi:MAG: ATP-binding cassette domain-containing protein [Planctomycetes bacterium]|nr:ATP-binding cassette domain-containing protein [Planctomycetota bacterium]
MQKTATQALLEVKGLVKHFPVDGGWFSRGRRTLKAVDDVSFDLDTGETLGLVGESGCGKTTLGRILLRLITPTAGQVLFHGLDLLSLSHRSLRHLRREMQIIFQDPYASLNPSMTVEAIVGEGLKVHRMMGRREIPRKVAELLDRVGLDPSCMKRFPHEFSGGQRQRIGIARALSVKPKFIVCDEPVSALDVSIQAQVINLLIDLRESYRLSYLFISHDLSVVRHISNRVAVMYLGRIVEIDETDGLFRDPRHPYTRALISAIPRMEGEGWTKRIVLGGEVPSPITPPPGCPFHTRCPEALPHCSHEIPPKKARGENGWYRCFLD